MNQELKKINKLFLESKRELPLVLHQVDVKEKQIMISGKSIQILKYKTNFYPIDNYYKYVTRILE